MLRNSPNWPSCFPPFNSYESFYRLRKVEKVMGWIESYWKSYALREEILAGNFLAVFAQNHHIKFPLNLKINANRQMAKSRKYSTLIRTTWWDKKVRIRESLIRIFGFIRWLFELGNVQQLITFIWKFLRKWKNSYAYSEGDQQFSSN